MVNIDKFESEFEFDKIKSKPFSPFGQLMGVLPASSGKVALPKSFSKLMIDPSSPIIDFYPTDFKLDLNGKMYNWQAVILLPFVDADRLVKTIKPLEDELNEDLKRMNGIGHTLIYCNKSHPMSRQIAPLYAADDDDDNSRKSLNAQLAQGINGFIFKANKMDSVPVDEALTPPNAMRRSLKVIKSGVNVISCCYKMPPYTLHRSELLDGVEELEPQLDATDFERMEKAPRFGKPRQFKRRDTHFNYNRGWDANIGYEGGKYKAKHRKNSQHELHYQQTRKEYNDHHSFQRPQAAVITQSKWIKKSSSQKVDNSHLSVKKFPVFDPYPNECDPYKHRPSNAPYPVDPQVDYSQFNNGHNNRNKRGRRGGHRQYNSQRNQQQQQQNYHQYNNRNNNAAAASYYHQQPAHQQWYPQQGYAPPQNQYYAQYQPQQQPMPYYSAQHPPQQQGQQQQYTRHYNDYNRQQHASYKPKQSNNGQNARKWG